MTAPSIGSVFSVATSARDESLPDVAALANGRIGFTWFDSIINYYGFAVHAFDGGAAFSLIFAGGSLSILPKTMRPDIGRASSSDFMIVYDANGLTGRPYASASESFAEPSPIFGAGSSYTNFRLVEAESGGSVVIGDSATGADLVRFFAGTAPTLTYLGFLTDVTAFDVAGNAGTLDDLAVAYRRTSDGVVYFNSTYSTFGATLLGVGNANEQVHIERLSNGNHVVLWTDDTGASRLAFFDAGGGAIVIGVTAGPVNATPHMAALDDGRVLVVGANLSSGTIEGRLFNPDGTADGAAFTIANGVGSPRAAVMADGRVVVTFVSATSGANDISAVIIDPREAGVDVAGTEGADAYVGSAFADSFILDAGDDSVMAGGGDDLLVGGTGRDTLDGGGGADLMRAGQGHDVYRVDSIGDTVIELANEGVDLVIATASFTLGAHVENLTLTGAGAIDGAGNGLDNVITGGSGANVLSGGAGADTLTGLNGADTLIGGAGKDLLTGGAGLDRMVLTALADSTAAFAGRDVINTFAHGDKIDLSAIDARTNVAGDQAFTFIGAAAFAGVSGQLRFDMTNISSTGVKAYTVSGDVNGDRAADFSVQIFTSPTADRPGQAETWNLFSWDFIL